jgi:hypothetical protein
MAHSEARAWWAEVQHLRDDYERTDEARRRADEADLASRRATRERRHVEAEVGSLRASVVGEPADPIVQPRRGSDASFAARRGQRTNGGLDPRRGQRTDGILDPRRGHHVDLPPAPRVRQGVAPIDAGSPRGPRTKGEATPGRVTVEIRGRTVPAPAVPRSVELERRHPPRRAVERVGTRPDRVAMWALMMGLLLILVAIGTADAPAVSSLLLR